MEKSAHHFWLISIDFCCPSVAIVDDDVASAKMLNHLRRLMNKFIFSSDFLVFSLNVSLLCSTAAVWGIFVCIVVCFDGVYLLFSAFIAAGVRRKFIISALCEWWNELNEPFIFLTHIPFSSSNEWTNDKDEPSEKIIGIIAAQSFHPSPWDEIAINNSPHICSCSYSIRKLRCSVGKLRHFP